MKSFQNLILLQNLYRLKALGFDYTDPFYVNEKSTHEEPKTLNELSQNISSCHLCDLSKSRQQSMSGYGNPNAELMIVDFSVSMSDDSNNGYYSGRSGESLTNMIEKVIGLKTDDVYFTHAIKCKPLNSNVPSASEWDSCKSYLFTQIDFVKPKVIVTLGEEAYFKLTSEESDFQNVRGHVIDFKKYKLIPIYHPQFLLRNPELKRITLNDLKTIKSCL
ncbi:uracil-DNA glycosilase superfamily protein [Sulfurimonas gotlandica GD1]|uniref:Uracil-DNA glycosilase superfamily protein n=1 Tax=Sulfurimonas gotlandica (strain DSM 19862 / JCM 16533 / GD1) TaxID=929558 RepID=B6BJY6_SULGG|nr:uracil-DNA glycosylase [Sulfurimonas gotlandica]EDZ62674.1 uracil-DNA glycosylase superfamily protein [Sulfurimonas gotlandica GD1]EHP31389.1 uracil-DNA glycosilase superfamily protein [Sulfurimonas gotlandica GD1]